MRPARDQHWKIDTRRACIAALALVLPTVSFLYCRSRSSNPPPNRTTPVTLVLIPERDADGNLSSSPSFWVTNHTEMVLVISLAAIEIRSGSAWGTHSRYSCPLSEIYFQTPRGRQLELNPHEAAYGDLDGQRIVLPEETPWRAKVSVGERLRGAANREAQIDISRRLAMLRLNTGNTNIPWHAFTKDLAMYKHRWTAVSQELVLESTAKQSSVRQSATEPVARPPAAPSEAIARAREAMRQKMTELVVEQSAEQSTAGTPK